MPDAHRYAQCAAGITGRGLHEHLVEGAFPQDAPVADAVQGHAAGETQVAHAGFLVREGGHLQHDLLGDLLNRSRQVHFALRERALGGAGRAAQHLLHLRAGHRQTGRVGEVLLVHPQAAIVTNLDQLILDGLDE